MSLEKLLEATKRLALAGSLMGSLFLGSCSVNKEANNFNALGRSARKTKERHSEKLRFNRNSNISLVSYKDISKALDDMREINQNTSMEEAYMGLKTEGSWSWYEIGENSSSQGVKINSDYLVEKLRSNQNAEKVYLVHNHSRSPYGDQRYPSRADLGYLYNVQNLLERKMPQAEAKGLIHSGEYITEYSFSEKGLVNSSPESLKYSESSLQNKNRESFRNHVDSLSDKDYLNLEFRRYQEN
ncbi:MAG: hypothetical protein ABEI74_00165 [Candidatus Pacearchaeota archaeon]